MPRVAARRLLSTRACAAVLGGVLVVGLAGACGPQDEGAGPSPVTATTTRDPEPPTPSPTASSIYSAPADAYMKPVRPAILDGKPSEDAAIAFAKYYLELYTYAYLTGDAKELNSLARKGCVYCAAVAKDIAREYSAGNHDEGGVISIDHASVHDYTVNGYYGVTLDGQQDPVREVGPDGRTVAELPQHEEFRYKFGLYWTKAAGWRVAELAVEPS